MGFCAHCDRRPFLTKPLQHRRPHARKLSSGMEPHVALGNPDEEGRPESPVDRARQTSRRPASRLLSTTFQLADRGFSAKLHAQKSKGHSMTPSTGHNTGVAPEAPATSFARIGNLNKIYDQMAALRRLVASAKPRSQRRTELEFQLRNLTTNCLRIEMRSTRRSV